MQRQTSTVEETKAGTMSPTNHLRFALLCFDISKLEAGVDLNRILMEYLCFVSQGY